MVRGGTWSASLVTADELYLLRLAVGNSGFLSSYDRDYGVPFPVEEGVRPSIMKRGVLLNAVWGYWGFLLS